MSAESHSQFLLVGNASYANRGCEAIIRGTMEILRREFGQNIEAHSGVYGDADEIARQATNETDPRVQTFALNVSSPRWSFGWIQQQFNRRLGANLAAHHSPLVPHIAGTNVVLEIGGDNFSLDYGVPRHLLAMDNFLSNRGLPIVIWGASIGPFDSEPDFAQEMFDHLRNMKAVFVRESLSRDYLAANEVSENVHLMSDPAFVMQPSELEPGKLGFELPEEPIGLNFSPLMAKYLIKEKLQVWQLTEEHLAPWTAFCVDAVLALAESTSCDILMIPHVGSKDVGIDDFRFLRNVTQQAQKKSSSKIFCVPDGLTASEMKGIISKCCVFAGARTHSTIAGLSTGVPTLSLGYSLKARGLNKDIFGSQDYCVDTSSLTLEVFLERMHHLLAEKESIGSLLRERMTDVKEKAYAAGSKLRLVLENL